MRTLFIFSILLLLPLSLWAGVGFVHEENYTISAFTPSLGTTQIVRLDDSGSIGFLWHSGSEVRLYDPALDSVIFSRTWDTGKSVLQAVVGDVMGDSTYDLAMVVANKVDYISPTDWNLICFDGATGLLDSVADTFTSNVITFYHYVGQMSMLDVMDIDDDNRKELVFSYNYVEESSWEEHVNGYTLAYDRFPDSLRWNRSYLTTFLQSMEDVNGQRESICRTYSLDYFDLGPDMLEVDESLHLLHSDGTLGSFSAPCEDSMCSGAGGYNECGLYSLAPGEILQQFVGDELIANRYNTFYCPYDGGSAYKNELVMLRLDASSPPSQMEEIWSISSSSLPSGLGNFIVHPDLPGYFFGIAGDTLIMFNGDNGSIRTTTTDLPSGQRYWDNNWPDSLPRLVVMNGHQVDIYTMDITTELGDEQAQTVPQTFLLGQPYPNPFNAETTIPINLPKRGNLKVEIYNLLGQTVATLVDRELPAGESKLTWDASDKPSGVYLVRAVSGDKTESRKLLLLK